MSIIEGLKRDVSWRGASIVTASILLGLDSNNRDFEGMPRSAWREAVANEETSLGYIDWVVTRLEDEQ